MREAASRGFWVTTFARYGIDLSVKFLSYPCATSISRRQWSLAPHSSTLFMARTFTLSWKPREAKT